MSTAKGKEYFLLGGSVCNVYCLGVFDSVSTTELNWMALMFAQCLYLYFYEIVKGYIEDHY